MKKLRVLWQVFRSTDADRIILGFVGFVFLIAFILTMVEPSIHTFGDGLWYTFAVFTTIGFGDLVAVTALGRILTIILGLYGILVVALIPGLLVSYYTEINKMRANESVARFLQKLERLPDLSREELAEISAKVKERSYKM